MATSSLRVTSLYPDANLLRILTDRLTREWWRFDPDSAGAWDQIYHWFNLFEGAAWFAFALLVLRMSLRHRKSSLELAYICLFFAFGLTDFHEAFVQSGPLVLLKGAILAMLITIRSVVLNRYYPAGHWF